MSELQPYFSIRSMTWFETIAGNQRTSSRQLAMSSETFADAPGDAERLRPVARDVDGDLRLGARPLELELPVVPLHGATVHEVLDHPTRALELRHLHRLQADHAPGGVAAADAHHHPSLREDMHGRIRAGEHG